MEGLGAEDEAGRAGLPVPLLRSFYAGRTTFVADAEKARAMVELASQRPLSWIGLDTEFRYDRPGVVIDKDHTAHDPRSVRPLLLSLALAEPGPDDGGGTIYSFVVDLRRPEVLDAVRAVLRLPCPFVGHFAQAELFCLWQLGIEEPRILWDTWVVEKALQLGYHHKGYKARPSNDEAAQARAAAEAEEQEESGLSLVATCRRRGVEYPLAGDKDRLRRSFLEHPDGAPFSREQVEYAAADASAAARLYPLQVVAAARAGLLHHLETVEMPWTVTNARTIWHGVRVDRAKARRVRDACERHRAELAARLAEAGVTNPRSHKQLREFFKREGLLPLFRRRGGYSFDKRQLAEFRDRHPAIALIREARRVDEMRNDRILTSELEGADGRVHPDYRQLGAHTGRQSSRWPNVLGLGRVFRPLIVPGPGRGIGAVDLSQIEVGIAAAVYRDERLFAQFNSGDVYSAMAQDFYRDRLPDDDRRLDGDKFKRRHPELRERMKTCTLGIIFGMTRYGLALYLGIGPAEAAALQRRFMAMFPTLERALREAAVFGGIRGYAATSTGLRRHRASRHASPSTWERNWLMNHPVQGSAVVVFKAAGNRLDRLYRRYDAWLVIALHDELVFESPLDVLGVVAELTGDVMCQAVEEHFPVLRPRVDVNIHDPSCWNKDGKSDSIDRWIADPMYRL
jgi:DNA polymerase-1